MKLKIFISVLLIIIASIAFFWKELFFLYIINFVFDRNEVSINREISWKQGPEVRIDNRPNIIVIVADDLGINDLTGYDDLTPGGTVSTPNIDFIANNGIKFKNAYAGSASCAPSRGMIVTGRYATSTGYEFTPMPDGMARALHLLGRGTTTLFDENIKNNPPYDLQGLPTKELTFADSLKKADYYTAHIGKWHLGRGPDFHPLARGFDESLLMASGLFMPEDSPDVVNAKITSDPIDKFLWATMDAAVSFNETSRDDNWFEPRGYLTDYFTNEAIKVIEANKNRPFFLYLAHWGVHTPLQAKREDYNALTEIKDHKLRVYAAMIRALDRSVGKIIETLKDNGLDKNTWVVFTSDNGGAGYIDLRYINSPYRGWKLTLFEGGIKVPLIFWKNGIQSKEINERAAHIDLLPTIQGLINQPLSSNTDGVDLFADNLDIAKRPLFWKTGHNQVVIKDDWKLQISKFPEKTWLYNLKTDPIEKIELSTVHPEKVSELQDLLQLHVANAKSSIYQPPLLASTAIDLTQDEGMEALENNKPHERVNIAN